MSICGEPSWDGPGLGKLHRPTGIDILLTRLGGLLRPDVGGRLPGLDGRLLALGVALAWRGDQGRVQDLARHRQISCLGDRPVEPRKQDVEPARTDQRLAKVPQRVGIGYRIARTEAAEPHPAQTVGHQILGLIQRQTVHRLQHEHPELQHRIETGAAAFSRIAPPERLRQVSPEHLEIHRRTQPLQRIAMFGQLAEPMLEIPEPALTSRHANLRQ